MLVAAGGDVLAPLGDAPADEPLRWEDTAGTDAFGAVSFGAGSGSDGTVTVGVGSGGSLAGIGIGTATGGGISE